MTDAKPAVRIDGSLCPRPDPHWGACADELLHHRSRYYHGTETFLRRLSGDGRFNLDGYRAEGLTPGQRRLLATLLSVPPDRCVARAVTRLLASVCRRDVRTERALAEQFGGEADVAPALGCALQSCAARAPALPAGVAPLDPFLSIMERLRVPVVVQGRAVSVPVGQVARHMDSPSHQVRENIQHAVVWLHEAGYHLRDRPRLTHRAVRQVAHRRRVH